jgi:hypothetical protein
MELRLLLSKLGLLGTGPPCTGTSIPTIQVCGIRNSDLWLWNVSEEPVQRGSGGAEWRGLGSADFRKTRVKFLIQAENLGLSALRSVIGAAFISYTKKLPSIYSVPESALL